MSHPFFGGVDWEAIHARTAPLPLTTAFVHEQEVRDETLTEGVNEFDRFSHYVDGTNRYLQKQLVKQLILSWLRYDFDAATVRQLADSVHGLLPFRGIGTTDSKGYFQYGSRREFLARVESEKTLFPQIARYLSGMTVRVDDDTMIFESDRCVCQWRAWGW